MQHQKLEITPSDFYMKLSSVHKERTIVNNVVATI